MDSPHTSSIGDPLPSSDLDSFAGGSSACTAGVTPSTPSSTASDSGAAPLEAAAAPLAACFDSSCGGWPAVSVFGPERTPFSAAGYTVRGADGREVFRRRSDFDQLAKALKQQYRGYFLPPAPGGAAAAEAGAEQAQHHHQQQRPRSLEFEAYLGAASAHAALRAGEELRLFLEHPGDLSACPCWRQLLERPPAATAPAARGSWPGAESPWRRRQQQQQQQSQQHQQQQVPPSPAASTASGGGAAASRRFGAGRAATGVAFARLRPPAAARPAGARARRPLTGQELQLREAKEAFRELRGQLAAACAAAAAVSGSMEGLCAGVAALAGPRGARGGAATPQLRAREALKAFSRRTRPDLAFLRAWQALVPGAITALEQREAALAAVDCLRDELAALEAALSPRAGSLAAAAAPDAALSPRAGGLSAGAPPEAVRALRERLAAAHAAYDLLKGRNLAELERLSLERPEDFRAAASHFAERGARLARAASGAWGAPAGLLQP